MKSVHIFIADDRVPQKDRKVFMSLSQKSNPWIEPAFVKGVEPSITKVIQRCIQKGAKEIFLVPAMPLSKHAAQEILPQVIADIRAKHLNLDFHYAAPLMSSQLPKTGRKGKKK